MGFTAGQRVDFDRVDDIDEGDDEVGGVFLAGITVSKGCKLGGKQSEVVVYLIVFVKG